MKRFVWGSLALAVMTVGLVLHQPVRAAAATADSGFNIITSPLPIKLSTTPGRTVTTTLRMKNQGSQAEGIKVGLMKFGATGDNGVPDLFNLGPKDTYGNWVTFSPSQFTAQPGVWDTVTMTIKVPANASLGYYLAVTFSRANQPGVPDATNLKGSVATLVLLEVRTPNEKRDVKLLSFTADHKLYEYLPVNFKIKVHNGGNIYVAPQGDIFISRGNKAIDTIAFNEPGGSVLPTSNRLYNQPWSNGFPVFKQQLVNNKPVADRHGLPKETLHWNFSDLGKFRFGHYTAKLLMVYNNGTQDVPLQASLSFWVLPWKLMLVALVLLAAIGFGLWSAGRSLFKKTRSGVSGLRAKRRHETKD